jgi:hypothetical protein
MKGSVTVSIPCNKTFEFTFAEYVMFIRENKNKILAINKSKIISYPYPMNKVATHPKFLAADVFDKECVNEMMNDTTDCDFK